MTDDALKTWFIISFFLDAFLILRKFISLMGICFKEKVYYMIVKTENLHLIDENKVGFTRHKLTYKVEVWLYDVLENKACFGFTRHKLTFCFRRCIITTSS